MNSFLQRMALIGAGLLFLMASSAIAASLKPYVLGNGMGGDLAGAASQAKSALQGQGFSVAGEYSPYADAQVVVVTNDALKSAAGKSANGGFGVAVRVSLTKTDTGIQVAYTNPAYMAAAFRMEGDLSSVSSALGKALGAGETFGSEKGLSDSELRKYHYMFAMPYFDDVDELGSFASYDAAVAQVEKQLAAGVAGTSKVFRIDVPGKQQTLFGVGLTEGVGADAKIAGLIDTGSLKHTPYLPYGLLVNGSETLALPGKFYIAVSFPDLGMGSFMKISDAPAAIAQVLKEVAGN